MTWWFQAYRAMIPTYVPHSGFVKGYLVRADGWIFRGQGHRGGGYLEQLGFRYSQNSRQVNTTSRERFGPDGNTARLRMPLNVPPAVPTPPHSYKPQPGRTGRRPRKPRLPRGHDVLDSMAGSGTRPFHDLGGRCSRQQDAARARCPDGLSPCGRVPRKGPARPPSSR